MVITYYISIIICRSKWRQTGNSSCNGHSLVLSVLHWAYTEVLQRNQKYFRDWDEFFQLASYALTIIFISSYGNEC